MTQWVYLYLMPLVIEPYNNPQKPILNGATGSLYWSAE